MPSTETSAGDQLPGQVGSAVVQWKNAGRQAGDPGSTPGSAQGPFRWGPLQVHRANLEAGRGSLVVRPDKDDGVGVKLDRVPASAQDLAALRTAVGGRVRVPHSERGDHEVSGEGSFLGAS